MKARERVKGEHEVSGRDEVGRHSGIVSFGVLESFYARCNTRM